MAQQSGLCALLHVMKTVFIIGLVSKMGLVLSLRLDEVAEVCPGNFITRDYRGWDFANETINATFYMPMASKYSLLLASHNLFQARAFDEINEAQLESSCMSGRRQNGLPYINVTGYNGDDSTLVALTPTTEPKLFRFNFGFPDVVTGAGYVSVALSDNESYNVLDYCFDNGLRSFAVLSTEKNLDENTRNIIKAHMKSLGFQEKNFVYLNYDNCFEKDGILITNGEDLPKPVEVERIPTYSNSIVGRRLVLPAYFG